MKNEFKTKYGNVKINKGYYVVTSSKEGNNMKLYHRLIFEDFYGYIPEEYVIHHKDGNKLNNCILNLQLLRKSEHHSLHNKGENNPFYKKKHTKEVKKKLSELKNSSGYFRVSKIKVKNCKQGFRYVYQYYDDDCKPKRIASIDINKLEEKVRNKGLE